MKEDPHSREMGLKSFKLFIAPRHSIECSKRVNRITSRQHLINPHMTGTFRKQERSGEFLVISDDTFQISSRSSDHLVVIRWGHDGHEQKIWGRKKNLSNEVESENLVSERRPSPTWHLLTRRSRGFCMCLGKVFQNEQFKYINHVSLKSQLFNIKVHYQDRFCPPLFWFSMTVFEFSNCFEWWNSTIYSSLLFGSSITTKIKSGIVVCEMGNFLDWYISARNFGVENTKIWDSSYSRNHEENTLKISQLVFPSSTLFQL